MLITIAIGKYLMNGYSVVKEQPIHRYVKRKTGKGLSVVLHLFPHLKLKSVQSVKCYHCVVQVVQQENILIIVNTMVISVWVNVM